MNINIIACGSLYVQAQDMIRGVPADIIQGQYRVDNSGGMRIGMNALLVSNGTRLVLVDPGCGDFLPAGLIGKYDLQITKSIELTLEELGYSARMVTDVVFTHIHFDHCSGAFVKNRGTLAKRFPNAGYHVLRAHFEYARKPDPREGNAHAARLFRYAEPLHWLEDWEEEWMELKIFHGHTRHLAVPGIRTGEQTVWFASDLVPMKVFLRPEASSAYDLEPDLAMREKVEFLENLDPHSEIIFFHDLHIDRMIYR